MIALVSAAGARLDAGSVGLALARRWSGSGGRVLFVDADTSGAALAGRLGEAMRADYSPAVRGLPSLMVARERLTLRLLADHCYSLDTGAGSLWALFAPASAAGGRHAAAWLGESVEDLMAVHRERSVVVAARLGPDARLLGPLLRAASVAVLVSPVESAEQAESLGALLDAGSPGGGRAHRLVVVEGSSPLGDEEVRARSGLAVAGRLPVLDDDRVLRLPGGRRERPFVQALDRLAARLAPLAAYDAAACEPAPPEPAPIDEFAVMPAAPGAPACGAGAAGEGFEDAAARGESRRLETGGV